MARNYFNRGEAGDVLAAGQAGWDDTQGRIDGMTQRRTNVQAGRQYGAGDRAGAARTLAESGDINGALTLETDQAKLDAIDYQRGRDTKSDEHQASQDQLERVKESFDHMKELTAALRQVPLPRRGEFIQHALPNLAQFMGPDFAAKVAALPPEQLSDDQLDVFDGGLDSQWQLMQTGNGGVTAFNKRSLDSRVLREPDKPLILHQGDTLMGEGNRPAYTAPKTFAPRGGGRGGGSGGGLSSMKTEDLIAALRR